MNIRSEAELIALALRLGAERVTGWSDAEQALVGTIAPGECAPTQLTIGLSGIRAGFDVLGEAFHSLRSPDQRRPLGAVYTPPAIVRAMLAWARRQPAPVRVIDPGLGSARFLVAAGRIFPDAQLVGVEIDPLAALLGRAHLAAAGMADRSTVLCGDYRDARLGQAQGPTLFLGNPPYVRHHQIDPIWKQWYAAAARMYGYTASQLAGLHAHFFMATAMHARPGDVGVFVTAAEWLDVNYGSLVRDLLLRDLGLSTLLMIEPTALPFEGTATTAVITGFQVGQRPRAISIGRAPSLDQLGGLEVPQAVHRDRLAAAPRWSMLIRGQTERREGHIQLGELFRVHRGQVTGHNRVWIAGAHSGMLPASVLYPTVTRARELFRAGATLDVGAALRQVIDLPVNLDALTDDEQRAVEEFLRYARAQGAADSYVAQHRRAWWAVGLRAPAPILATYMARRPPIFVRNEAGARHINIAHGLYPRAPLDEATIRGVALYLNTHVALAEGRMYAGGLTKFEPREMERLLIPEPAALMPELGAEVRV